MLSTDTGDVVSLEGRGVFCFALVYYFNCRPFDTDNFSTLTPLVCVFAWRSSSLLTNLLSCDMARDSMSFELTPRNF